VIDIDETLLIKLAGARAFARGLYCYEEGRVGNVKATEKSTTAVVRGEQRREVRLQHSHRQIEGVCDCPASDGIDFCEHCVAVALFLQERRMEPKPYSKKRAMIAIRRHLSTLSAEALLREFLAIIGSDRALRDDLLQKAQFASGALSYADLRKMIEDTALQEELADFREVRAYLERFDTVLHRIAEHAEQMDTLVLLRATECAIKQLNFELAAVNDHGDFGWQTMETLGHVHRIAVGRLAWSPAEIAAYLVDRAQADSWHPFKWDADLYASDLGDAFCRALVEELDSRLDDCADSNVIATANRKGARDRLEELRANLSGSGAVIG
jgi:ADP-ribose pyrophosphatase YjhB (NUDIX family)